MSTWPDAASWTASADGDEPLVAAWCSGCQADRLLAVSLVMGREQGLCEFCWSYTDVTVDDGCRWGCGCAGLRDCTEAEQEAARLRHEATVAFCPECQRVSTYAPDQNEDNDLPSCQTCGTLMDGAADCT